jgi:hypothetical protein
VANGLSDPTAAKAAITTAYKAAFKGGPNGAKYIQNAALIPKTLAFAAALAKKSPPEHAVVKTITITSASTADVTYDLFGGGKVILPGADGKAVFAQGGWKLASATLCGLLQLATSKQLQGC